MVYSKDCWLGLTLYSPPSPGLWPSIISGWRSKRESLLSFTDMKRRPQRQGSIALYLYTKSHFPYVYISPSPLHFVWLGPPTPFRPNFRRATDVYPQLLQLIPDERMSARTASEHEWFGGMSAAISTRAFAAATIEQRLRNRAKEKSMRTKSFRRAKRKLVGVRSTRVKPSPT